MPTYTTVNDGYEVVVHHTFDSLVEAVTNPNMPLYLINAVRSVTAEELRAALKKEREVRLYSDSCRVDDCGDWTYRVKIHEKPKSSQTKSKRK